jgi:hypothetical protein
MVKQMNLTIISNKQNVELIAYLTKSQKMEEVWNADIPISFYNAAKQAEYIEN